MNEKATKSDTFQFSAYKIPPANFPANPLSWLVKIERNGIYVSRIATIWIYPSIRWGNAILMFYLELKKQKKNKIYLKLVKRRKIEKKNGKNDLQFKNHHLKKEKQQQHFSLLLLTLNNNNNKSATSININVK